MRVRRWVLVIGSISPLLTAAVVARAQVQAGEAGRIEEIVVTAQRREESLLNVPMAVTAHTGRFLEERHVLSIDDLSMYTPGLQVLDEFTGGELFLIRGIGKANEDLATDSGVAVFLDEVYLARKASANIALFDIERVEVLKGPQGTLWGKNATGGAISIITRKPTDQPSGYISLDIGDYSTVFANAAFSGPLVEDTLNGRIALTYRERDGMYRNLTTGDLANNIDTQGVRGSLQFMPSERVTIDITADWVRDEQEGVLKSIIADVPGTPYILKDFFAADFETQEDDIRSARSGTPGKQGIEQYGMMARAEVAFDGFDLVSVSGYRKEESYSLEDADRAPQRSSEQFADQDTSTFSEELRLISTNSDRLDWTVGLYWLHDDGDRDQSNYLFAIAPGGGGLAGPGSPSQQNSTTTWFTNLTTESYAAFGQATYGITDRFRVTGGLRYTRETKDYSVRTTVVGHDGFPDIALFINAPFNTSDSETWTETTPKVSLQYDLADNVHTYLSYTEGFKSGGYDGRPGGPAQVVPFLPEHAEAYELGLKGLFLDRRMRATLAVYHTDFTDLQQQGFNPVTGVPITANAADAKIDGVELELLAQPTDRLTLRLGASWLDPVFEDWFVRVFDPTIAGGPPFRIVDRAGDRIGDTPEYSYFAGVDYSWQLPGGSTLALQGEWVSVDDTVAAQTQTLRGSAYDLTNVRAAWTSADAAWEATLWIRNVFDEVYYRSGGPVPDFFVDTVRLGSVGDPRLVGVSITRRFGDG